MRILQVIPFFSPKMGGSPQVVYQAALHLSKRGHQVTVVASDFGIEAARFPDAPFQVKLFPNLFARWGFYLSPGLFPWLLKHIKEFDVVHLHEYRTFQNIAAHALVARLKIPYVLSAHGTLPVIIERKGAKRLFDFLFGKRILAGAQKLVAVSPAEVGQYLQAGIAESRVSIIYNGLNLNEFNNLPLRGSFRSQFSAFGMETKLILYLGRIHKRKGINCLIEAFARLHQLRRDTHLVIAGPDDGDLANLQTISARLGLENFVHFVGPQYGCDRLAAYVDADVFASPAIFEIFGLVAFEALLCGTPVIVGDDCGTGQMISAADAGYPVPYGNIEQLAQTLQHVLDHTDEAAQKVANGRAFIREKLDWQQISRDYERLYQELSTS